MTASSLAAAQSPASQSPTVENPALADEIGSTDDSEIEDIRRRIQNDPDNGQLQGRLGQMLVEQGRYEEAVEVLQPLVERLADFSDDIDSLTAMYAHISLGHALSGLNRFSEAEAAYRTAMRIHPEIAWPYSALGNFLRDQGRYQEAADVYREAIIGNFARSEIFVAFGDMMRDLGDEEYAESIYLVGIRLDMSHESFARLQDLLRSQGRYEEAEAVFDEPRRYWLEVARRRFQAAIQLNPEDAAAYREFGMALRRANLLEEAEQTYREAIRLNPDYADAYHGLALALAEQTRYEEAESAFHQSLRLDPENSYVYESLGRFYHRQNQYDVAIEHYQSALERVQNDERVMQNNSRISNFLSQAEDCLAIQTETGIEAPDEYYCR